MRKITDFIVDHCYVILAIMIGLACLSGFASTKVKINHNILKYMPDSSETSKGYDVMDDEFKDVATSNYTIMFENLADDEKDSMKKYFEGVKGVDSVDYDDSDEYNREKDGVKYTLYSISVHGDADAEEAANAYKEIHGHLKDAKNDDGEEKYTFYEKGDVANDNGSVLNIAIIIIAIAIAMVIITIMSESFIEPWLYLTSIGIAIAINMGTNIIFPNISHITNSIAAILQLALSMDYSIMLAERYRQERKLEKDKVKAMKNALSYSFSSISASSVTTIVGLIVLVFMSFTIGRDMGLVLSKGVLLSLVSIFTTLPAFLLLLDKPIMNSKKHSPRFKVDFMGTYSYHFRHFAIPVFIVIFIASMLCKGNVGIEYTDASNSKISDVFDETNQIAVIYKNEDEARLAKVCRKYQGNKDVKQALCFGNTIGEQEKYNEMKTKAKDLGSEINVDDYLIKTLYYHYYDPNETNEMTLEEFTKFVQNDILNDKNFKDDVDADTRSNIERLSNFTIQNKMNQEQSLSQLAKLFEMDENKLREVFVLYGNNEKNSSLGKNVTNSKITLAEFVKFMNGTVLKDPTYSKQVDNSAKQKLQLLGKFVDKKTINKKMSATEVANLLGIDKTSAEKIYQYEAYLAYMDKNSNKIDQQTKEIKANAAKKAEQNVRKRAATEVKDAVMNSDVIKNKTEAMTKAMKAQVEAAIKKEASDPSIIGSIIAGYMQQGMTQEQAQNAAVEFVTTAVTATAESRAQETQKSMTTVVTNLLGAEKSEDLSKAKEAAKEAGFTDDEINKLLEIKNDKVSEITKEETEKVTKEAIEEGNKLQAKVTQEIMHNAKTVKNTPVDFVNFILAHQNDDQLKGSLSKSTKESLNLAKTVMSAVNSDKKYSYSEFSKTYGIEESKLRLLYSLNYFKNTNKNPKLSVKTLVNFINSDVLTSKDYGSAMSNDQKETLSIVTDLMKHSEAGDKYTAAKMYGLLNPLAKNLDSDLIDMLYMYYGSLHNYDKDWTMSLEQFVNYLHGTILKDKRFDSKLDDKTRKMINDADDKIADAKKMLVGPKHSRAVLNTTLAPEGDDTFNFIKTLKDDIKSENADVFVIGNSPMAYEMSQTFSDENNFITLLTMISIFVVAAFTFKSLLIPAILVLIIQTAVWITMSILSFAGSSVYFIAMIIVQSILMGATIDYAILYTSYYLEHRRKGLDMKKSLSESYNKSLPTIITSASVLVIVTYVVGTFDKQGSAIAAKICVTISQGTLCSAILILLILPALLASCDKMILRHKK